MPRIVDLDKLVPEDIEFTFRGERYLIPGDLDVDTTFRLIRLFERAADAAELDEREKINRDIADALTDIFRQRQPDLEALPFGVVAFQHVLAEVLQALGLQVVEEEKVVPPAKPGPRQRKMTPPKSRRSTGSRKS